eukprot:4826157-Pyramimonas_sp.AAC.1
MIDHNARLDRMYRSLPSAILAVEIISTSTTGRHKIDMPSDQIPAASTISMYPLGLAKAPEFAEGLDRVLLAPPTAAESDARLAWAKACVHSAAARARRRTELRFASTCEECHRSVAERQGDWHCPRLLSYVTCVHG